MYQINKLRLTVHYSTNLPPSRSNFTIKTSATEWTHLFSNHQSNSRGLPLKAALYTLSMWKPILIIMCRWKAYLVSECETEIIFVWLHNTKQALLTPNTNQFSLFSLAPSPQAPQNFYFMYVTKEIINVNNKLRIIKHSKHIFHGKFHCCGFGSNVATR